MAKSKRRPSSNQRDKANIEAAKRLKSMGLLSKNTKLHGGKFISQRALKRVHDLQWIIQNNSRAIKVNKAFASEADRQGMIVLRSGGRQFTVVPNKPTEVRRARRGIVSGVVPVPGGQMYAVKLPYDTMSDFVDAVRSGELDAFKDPKEHFGFTYFGNMSRRSFRDSKELREWLERYDFLEWVEGDMSDNLQKAYANFHLYRMLPNNWNPSDFVMREEFRRDRKRSMQQQHDERIRGRKSRRIADMSEARAEQIREADKDRKKVSRDRMKSNDPARYAAMLKANAERARSSQKNKRDK